MLISSSSPGCQQPNIGILKTARAKAREESWQLPAPKVDPLDGLDADPWRNEIVRRDKNGILRKRPGIIANRWNRVRIVQVDQVANQRAAHLLLPPPARHYGPITSPAASSRGICHRWSSIHFRHIDRRVRMASGFASPRGPNTCPAQIWLRQRSGTSWSMA